MKEGWSDLKITDIATIIHGKNQKEVECENGQYPIYGSGGNIMGYSKEFLCEEGTIILGRKGSINNPIFINTKFWNVDTAFGIVAKNGCNKKYLYYFMKSYNWAKLNTGTTIPSLTQKVVGNVEIPVPSLPEQQRIVDFLDTEFAKIDALKANAEKNLQNAKDLFQAALKKELEPKEGWRAVSIGDIAELKGGKRVPKGYKLERKTTGYPYIRVADFDNNGSVNMDDIHYISEDVYKNIKRYTISVNDVYISIAGTIGKSGIIPIALDGANLTENACRLVLKENINNKYIYYCTINMPFKEQLVKHTMQAAQPKLALTRLATSIIHLPSILEQNNIVLKLDKLSANCQQLQTNYEKTIALCDDMKQALLRKAFNGEL